MNQRLIPSEVQAKCARNRITPTPRRHRGRAAEADAGRDRAAAAGERVVHELVVEREPVDDEEDPPRRDGALFEALGRRRHHVLRRHRGGELVDDEDVRTRPGRCLDLDSKYGTLAL